MLLLLGGAHLVVGSLALIRPEALAGSRADLLLGVGLSALGWLHLVLGAALMVVGGALIMGRVWARGATIGLCGLAVLVNFGYAAAAPVWSVLAIGFTLVVLYATVAHGRELTEAYQHG
ncbi:DUF7144 family membrane protein [Paractinoplanes rishiriensis]|uniref:DUF7144 family membrane protein n=1 Tax=Paractinoplanes rishiriensis TaxID=1050105 RepID=UPI003F68E67C